jgi:hypothetical protein
VKNWNPNEAKEYKLMPPRHTGKEQGAAKSRTADVATFL